MESNQQQTDLPQETSPHHVYGNQPFSRDRLIVTQGEGEGGKNNWILLIFLEESQQIVYSSPTRIICLIRCYELCVLAKGLFYQYLLQAKLLSCKTNSPRNSPLSPCVRMNKLTDGKNAAASASLSPILDALQFHQWQEC
ncbi:hypothetical protein Q8A73_012104 [Channa argus]|nr:hypothetical protein Q8A73_012104 [Channa argus]